MANNGTSHSTQHLFPDWQPQYMAAVLETDPQKLQGRVFSLEEAIVKRMQSLADAPGAEAERHAIEHALRALRVLQVERLQYPVRRAELPGGL